MPLSFSPFQDPSDSAGGPVGPLDGGSDAGHQAVPEPAQVSLENTSRFGLTEGDLQCPMDMVFRKFHYLPTIEYEVGNITI